MKKINAIDLDKTLLPYDSMRALTLRLLAVPRLSARVLVCAVLRKTGLMSRKKFLVRLVGLLRGMKGYPEFVNAFSAQLFGDLSAETLALVRENSDDRTINVLCTASPSDYALKLAERLGWDCVCSLVEEGAAVHAYGETKKDLLLKKYPAGDYEYNFAVSDSAADLGLLKLFKKHKLV